VSRVTFKASAAGTYRVVAATFKAGMTGGFTLKATVAEFKPPKIAALTFDGTNKVKVTGALTTDDGMSDQLKYYKAFTFQAEKGKAYRFELTGGDKKGIDPEVRIEDEEGKVVRNEDFGDGKVSRVLFVTPLPRTYRAIVTTFEKGMTGDFTLSASVIPIKAAKPVAIKLDKGKASIESKLEDDDAMLMGGKHYQEYTFAAEAGQTYRIDLHSKAFDAYLILKDSTGKTLAENDDAPGENTLDSRIVWKAAKAETLHVLATSLGGGRTGPFVLTIGEPKESDKLMARIDSLFDASPAERKALVADMQKHFAAQGAKLDQDQSGLAMRVLRDLEETDKPLAASAYRDLGKLFAAASDAGVARSGKLMVGAGKRLSLVGQPMTLKGTTTDGKAFDLAQMKGKVVLVDFWATWCGPCKAELPNMKKLYEKYHKDGFDIIGVSLDDKEKTLVLFIDQQKLPWPSIFEGAGAVADDYGIMSIPVAILVGRDGRVISLDARGAELDRLLEKEFKK
jgi:thiol-disulfide isomerase/thioredoxin